MASPFMLDQESRSAVEGVQLSMDGMCPISEALAVLSGADAAAERGAIFTRREVVDFILDLAGYTVDNALHTKRMLEPSFGGGDFLLPVIERLLTSWRKQRRKKDAVADLSNSIRAVELHGATYAATRARIIEHLAGRGIGASEAMELADTWLVHGDFLLAPLDGGFDFVIGNPPYVRQELIPDQLLAEYRARYRSVYDRADLYVRGLVNCDDSRRPPQRLVNQRLIPRSLRFWSLSGICG